MSHAAAGRVLGNVCAVHGSHRPTPVRTVKHHVWPQEFGGPTVPENLLLVCDTGHYNIHAALDALRTGHPVPKVTRAELRYATVGFAAITKAGGRHLPDAAPRADGLDVRWGSEWRYITSLHPELEDCLWTLAGQLLDQGMRLPSGSANPFWRDDVEGPA